MIVRSFLTLFSLLTALLASGLSIPACADVTAEQIKGVAEVFLKQHSHQLLQQYGETTRIESRIDPLDSRLKMTDCPLPVTAKLKSINSTGRINIEVRCDSNIQWTLYVPAEIKVFHPVVMPVAPVPRNVKLTAADLELREADISQLNGSYFTSINDVVGMEARRLLSIDRPIIAAYLKPSVMINKGDAVIVTANSGGLMVKMPGIALRDGYQGQQISVRNTQSDRVVEALVTAPGQVEVPM